MENNPIDENKKLVVLGSLNANEQDREMARENVVTMQMVNCKLEVIPANNFNNWGELGISSMCCHPHHAHIVYIATSDEVYKLDLNSRQVGKLNITHLSDIHEITIIENNLWISNTHYDELVSFDISNDRISKRIKLAQFSEDESFNDKIEPSESFKIVDTFHCNQIFKGFDGDLYILVHHVSGRQLIQKIAQKLLKSQGNGGVINVNNGEKYRLNLKAPHSVRKVDDQYWIFDSAHILLKIFNKEWDLIKSIDTKGYGRGGVVDKNLGFFYAGISAIRKRYVGVLSPTKPVPNMVQIISLKDYTLKKEIVVPNIEQINNVYLIPNEVAEKLLKF